MEEHIPENRVVREGRPPEDRTTIVNSTPKSSGGWAAAVILAVLVAGGVFYFASSGPGDNVDPNATTSAIESQETAPAGGADTDGAAGTQPLEAQPDGGQPAGAE